jgi:hypothetical protein
LESASWSWADASKLCGSCAALVMMLVTLTRSPPIDSAMLP